MLLHLIYILLLSLKAAKRSVLNFRPYFMNDTKNLGLKKMGTFDL